MHSWNRRGRRNARRQVVLLATTFCALAFAQVPLAVAASPKPTMRGSVAQPVPAAQFSKGASSPAATAPAAAAAPLVLPEPATSPFSYGFDTFTGDVYAVRWELAAVTATLAVIGFKDWDWGGSSFKTIDEGWFGSNTRHGGMDKIGHGYSTYVISDLLTDRIRANGGSETGAAITGAVLGFGIMGIAETVDGFTGRHRFSSEDIIANGAGALFAVVRNTVPGLRDKLDFRLLYTPASWEKPGITPDEFTIIPPYERQRYILALKGSGFEPLKSTPLRYVELQAGFEARGFGDKERQLGYPIERTFYAGVGINLNEVLFGEGNIPNLSRYRDTLPGWATRKAFEYLQVPYTAVYAGNTFSRVTR